MGSRGWEWAHPRGVGKVAWREIERKSKRGMEWVNGWSEAIDRAGRRAGSSKPRLAMLEKIASGLIAALMRPQPRNKGEVGREQVLQKTPSSAKANLNIAGEIGG